MIGCMTRITHIDKRTLIVRSAITLTAIGIGAGGFLLIHYVRSKKASNASDAEPKAIEPPTPRDYPHDHAPTIETLMSWVSKSARGEKKRIPNNDLIPRLEREYFGAFPLIKTPQDLKECPVGTIIYDRNYELMTAQDNPVGNDEDVLIHRGPLHILAVPRK